MRAVALFKGSFQEIQLPVPEIKENDLLIEVKAVGMNPADLRVRERITENEDPKILGWDCAGIVRQVGACVQNFKVGDKVFYSGDLNRPGVYAELNAVDHRLVGKMPSIMDFVNAAGFPLTMLTAWELLFEKIKIQNEAQESTTTILVIGAAGGVGTALLQLLKIIPRVKIIATASQEKSYEWCRSFSPDLIVNHHQDIKRQLQSFSVEKVDHIICLHNPDKYLQELSDFIRPYGSFSTIVPFVEKVDLNILMRRSISMHWEYMFTKAAEGTWSLPHQGNILNQISQYIESGRIRSPVTEILEGLNVLNIEKAHSRLKELNMIGKLVIAI